jgi:hypothetical protein
MDFMKLALFIVAATMASGCAGLSSVEMSPANRAQVKTIKVRADSKMPEEMFFQGRAQSVSAAFGLIGAVVGEAMSSDPKAQIIATMKSNKIDLPTIVQAEFVKAMQSQNGFRVVDGQSSADAEMVLFVNTYGLGQTQGFSSLLYPLMNVSASLRRPDGTVIWQKTDYVTPQNKENTGGHEFEEYLGKPETLRGTWSNAAGIVSRMLVRELSHQ